MPELPEVETTCRALAPLIDHDVTSITVREPRLRWPVETTKLKRLVQGQTLLGIERRAKYILMNFANGSMVVHLGMSGSLQLLTQSKPIQKHAHIDWLFSSGLILRYHDPRRFGCVLITTDLAQLPQLQHLGPEPLSQDFNTHYLWTKAQAARTNIKTLIMNQQVVVGVGNIYACESLFLAQIHPSRPANRITKAECKKLCECIHTVLQAAIKQGGTTLRDFFHSDGKPGYFAQKLAVYDRENETCQHCRTLIFNLKIAGRSSFFCPQCQV